MTDETPGMPPEETARVFAWFAQPQVGRESIIMALTQPKDGELIYRPLLALDRDVADSFKGTAQAAATDLGMTAVLREFVLSAVHTKVEP